MSSHARAAEPGAAAAPVRIAQLALLLGTVTVLSELIARAKGHDRPLLRMCRRLTASRLFRVGRADVAGRERRARGGVLQADGDTLDFLDAAPVAMTVHAEGRIMFANRVATALLGAAEASELVGRHVLDLVHPDEREKVRDRLGRMEEGDSFADLEERMVRLDGKIIDVLLSASAVGWQGKPALHVVLTDVTGRRRTEELLRYSATHDALTGLGSRALFEAEMARLAAGRRFPVSIVFADVDGLRRVNDRYGHLAGDALLRSAAEVLQLAFRAEDTPARVGGDELVVLMPGAGPEGAARATDRVRQVLRERRRGGQEPALCLSLGFASAAAGPQLAGALRRAEAEMLRDRTAARSG